MSLEIEIYTKDFLEDDIGVRSTRKFLQNIIKLFAEESFEFYNYWGEFPFIYSEKQLNSVIVPAIHKYTKNIWLEQPFKKKKNNCQRFLDIATTKGKNIYLIELKHSWNSKLDSIAKDADKKWEKALEQISDINRKTIGKHFNCTEYNVFKMVLMIMPTYINSNEKHDILNMSATEYVKILYQEYDRYLSIKNRANFIGTIKLNKPIEYEHKFENGNQIFPFISFIVRVEKI